MTKKLLAALLCLAMVVALMPATAFADTPTVALGTQSGRLITGNPYVDGTFTVTLSGFTNTPVIAETDFSVWLYSDEAGTQNERRAYENGFSEALALNPPDSNILTMHSLLSTHASPGVYYIKLTVVNHSETATSNVQRLVVCENLDNVVCSVTEKTLTNTTTNMAYSLNGTTWISCDAGTTNIDDMVSGGTLTIRDQNDTAYTRTLPLVATPAAPTMESRGFNVFGTPQIVLEAHEGYEYAYNNGIGVNPISWRTETLFYCGRDDGGQKFTFWQRVKATDTSPASLLSPPAYFYTLPKTPDAVPLDDIIPEATSISIKANKSNDKYEYAVTPATVSSAPETGWVQGTGNSGSAITIGESLEQATAYKVWVRVKSYTDDGNVTCPASAAISTQATTARLLATGDFTVSGGAPLTDYTYQDGVLTITGAGNTYRIGMYQVISTDDRIVVNTTGNVTLALDGVNITAPEGAAALTVTRGNVTLNMTALSTLTGGSGNNPDSGLPGIDGSVNMIAGMLTVTGGNASDSATSVSDNGGRGIQGNVNVAGGTLTVVGGNGGRNNLYGSALGGGEGGNGGDGISGTVTVTGGSLSATGGNGGSGWRTGSSGKGVGSAVTANPADFVIKAGDSASATLSVLPSPAMTDKKYVSVALNEQVAFQRVDDDSVGIERITTALILTFSSDVDGFSANDITLTGATKGALTKESGTGQYKLDISNITVVNHGYVTVAVAKAGFVFTPANKNVMVTSSIPPVLDPSVTSVEVNPASVRIHKGGRQPFTATVEGGNDPVQAVIWSVEGGVTGTGIDEHGVLTIAANETAATLSVKATSMVNPTKSGTATVTVTLAYKITQGQGSKWPAGSVDGLGFTADGVLNQFTDVSVDGRVLSDDDYTARSGSTIVTLKPAYLKTLSLGRHTLRVNFLDGYAETYFTVLAEEVEVPKTGDGEQPILWLGLALMAGALLFFSALRRKQQNG